MWDVWVLALGRYTRGRPASEHCFAVERPGSFVSPRWIFSVICLQSPVVRGNAAAGGDSFFHLGFGADQLRSIFAL